eukprot:TRINITY_DN1241_c9_g1_i1.p1 TRINITY_DN1241_c9_g1~~TRINITY_DN1241_c9_g1_i1.p1  ORF type:complete len:531 (+),score=140.86 TRINITY_DN1241_c9_g1_i1:108-1595(+)
MAVALSDRPLGELVMMAARLGIPPDVEARITDKQGYVEFVESAEAGGDEFENESALLQARREVLSTAMSVSYANTDPLWMVTGDRQYLIDRSGRRFLDTRNNVAHCGHTHPAVAAAVRQQVSALNTNTRYLHPNVVRLAKKLASKLPKELCRVFFVNSGSEANDLAMRLAEMKTGRKECIVVDRAYHGHTVGAMSLSPYKYEHPRSHGQLPHVRKVPCPDTFRGLHRGADAAEQYSLCVKDAVEDLGGRVSAFFIESGMSVAGVILPPPGYLAKCYEYVRAAGGVCVADEVQTGFGRFGSSFWGFEQQGVVPDIVTMGKPFGNGMPLAAVACTEAVSAAFSTGPEYFNTFAGNPVCAAAGLAVMDTVERERLQENAAAVGAKLSDELRGLQTAVREGSLCHVGDVRGSGLFIGVDFVTEAGGREPATKAAGVVCSRLKDRHLILTSLDGPADNVMVIKPPMCFSEENVGVFVTALKREMEGVTAADVDAATHTPT